jgi:hypothetical protein
MSTSQVLDRTFSLYRRNFLLFAGIAALPPAFILAAQLLLLLLPKLLSELPAKSIGIGTTVVAGGIAILGGIAVAVFWLVGYAMATGASVYAVSRVHLGYSATIGESYRLIRPHAGRILGIVLVVSICVGLLVAAGAACLVVPMALTLGARSTLSGGGAAATILIGGLVLFASLLGALVLSAKFALCVPACVLEGRGVMDSIRRGWNLTRDTVLRLILIFILTGIMTWIMSMVLSIPYFIGVVLFVSRKDPAVLLPFIVWQHIAGFIASTLAGPVGTISAALIYFDQRVRKEAFDLQLMMDAVGGQAPPPAATAATPSLG